MAEMSYPLDNTLYTASYPQLFLCTRGDGVFSSNKDLVVTAGSGMTVNVSPGIAWLNPTRFVGLVFANTESKSVAINTADGLRARRDRLFVRLDNIANDVTLHYRAGSPAANPTAPQPQRDAEAYEIVICEIIVPAGALSSSSLTLNNAIKLDETVCGVMRDGVSGIPTQQLYDDWWAWFSNIQTTGEAAAADLTAWIATFKATSASDFTSWFNAKKSDFDSWYSAMVGASTAQVGGWFSAFSASSESDFNTWFQNLQNQLDDNQASNLQNQIDQHKATGIFSDTGVHKLRFHDNKLQFYTGTGWATIATAKTGITWEQVESLGLTRAELDLMLKTWEEITNMIFEED